MTMIKREVVELWFSEIWDAGNISALDTLLSPTLAQDDPIFGGMALRKDLPFLVEMFGRLMGPMQSEILVYLEDGDWASVYYRTTASGPDGDTPLSIESLLMLRFEQGLIAELISKIDCLALFEQLGQMPPDTMMGCFSGQGMTWKYSYRQKAAPLP